MFIFPAHILTPLSIARRVEGQVLSGGTSLAGEEDTIYADGGGRWLIEYTGIELPDEDTVRVWEAWSEYLSGGVVECLVPLISFATSPRSYLGTRKKRPSNLYYDDREWPTVLRYSSPEHEAEFAADAALRATTVALTVQKGPHPRGGEVFSYDGRAHRIIRKTGENLYLIRPPLRQATPAGTPAIFDFPLVKATAARGQQLGVPLFRGQQATVGIQFWESV